MRAILCCLLATVLSLNSAADDKKEEKIDAAKLVGKWKWPEQKGKYPGTIEFRKDGTMKATLQIKGEEYPLPGKYRVEGNKVIIVLTMNVEHDEVYIVNKLTDTELVWTAEKDKEKETHTRVKDK
jgi:uncharacterized protein (TIGR03066 family)